MSQWLGKCNIDNVGVGSNAKEEEGIQAALPKQVITPTSNGEDSSRSLKQNDKQ